MQHTPTVMRLGLWRVTRHDRVRAIFERLADRGVYAAQLDRIERPTTTARAIEAAPPTDVGLDVTTAVSWRPEALATAPLAPGDRFVVARRDGDPIGWCCLSDRPVYVPELRERLSFEGAYLWRLFVTPEERGRGVGRSIVARALDTARERLGRDRLIALVAPDNVPSRLAFDALGFTPTERITAVGCAGLEARRRRSLATTG